MSDFYTPDTIDVNFYAKPKKGSGKPKLIELPEISYPIKFVDSHAHINMLNNPSQAIARSAFYGVKFIECMVDVLSEEGTSFYDDAESIFNNAQNMLLNFTGGAPDNAFTNSLKVPDYGISVGIHPHYASNYSENAEETLIELLDNPKTNALGEVGLDYHYDFSPRQNQRDVFERQLQIAKDKNCRVILHIREAFDDAYAILDNFDFMKELPVLLHCYTSDSSEIKRWIESDCYIAFGGAITFASTDDIRKALMYVPKNRLLIETDAPYMAPVPFRGVECESSHMLFTYKKMLDILLISKEDEPDFNKQLFENSKRFFEVNCG